MYDQKQSETVTGKPAAWVAFGAGVAGIAGSFLPWFKLTGPLIGSATTYGVESTAGKLTIVFATIVAVYAFLRTRRAGLPLVATVLAVVSALLLMGTAMWKMLDLLRRASNLIETLGGAVANSSFEVTIGAALWLVLAAGMVAAIALACTLPRRRRPR